MSEVHYHIVEHDGGWAYKLGAVFSETFPNRPAALAAARRVVVEQQRPGRSAGILYQDETGQWRAELADGEDRPIADVS